MTYCDKSVLAPYCDNPLCAKCREHKDYDEYLLEEKKENKIIEDNL